MKLPPFRPEKGLEEGKRQPWRKETPREMKLKVPRVLVTRNRVFGLNCQDQKILKYFVTPPLSVWIYRSEKTFPILGGNLLY